MTTFAQDLTALLAKRGGDYYTEFETFMTRVKDEVLDALERALGYTTSATSHSIGTGSKTFTMADEIAYGAGAEVVIARAAAPSTRMFGTVTARAGTSLTVNMTVTEGSGGPYTDWTIQATGARGADGSPAAASETTAGIVELATSGETATGTDNTRAVTPAGGNATYVAQGLHTIWIPAVAMVARTTNGAGSGTVETTTNKVMLKTLDFDPSTSEYAQFAIRMPKSWDEGAVTAAFTWSHPSTSTNFGVVFGIQGLSLSNDDAADTAFGTAQTAADTGGTTNDIYISPTTSAITIAGSPAAEDWVVFQVYRAVSDGSDTMAVDARLHGLTLYYTVAAATDA